MTNNDTVKMTVGERVVLPFANVTRIITEDDEIARALFQSGNAVLEGSSPGSTTVEIYQTNGTPKVLTVQVSSSATSSDTPASSAPAVAEVAPISLARSPLTLSLGVAPAPGNPSQAVLTFTYGNPGLDPVQNAVIRFPLDERVSFVTGSASPGARYDAALREVSWKIGVIPAGQVDQKLTLRVAPIENQPTTFRSSASIEDASGTRIASNEVPYSTSTTPLLTIFALPDRFLAGKNSPVMVDVKGSEAQAAVERLVSLGIAKGTKPGFFVPAAPTQRAEYAVMTLNGLNLRDLRDITQIKFVLGRRSLVNLNIQDATGRNIVNLISNTTFDPGEQTKPWNGRINNNSNFAPPGRYTYVCTAKDARGQVTTLKGTLNIVAQTPLNPKGVPSFVDVKPSDWFASYLALGEQQKILRGYKDGTFRPTSSISRTEAAAIVVRALGLEDLAKEWKDKNSGFYDYDKIPNWAMGDVNVVSTVAKTMTGRPIFQGDQSGFFQPDKDLRRDEAALIVQRVIDRETTRRITVSGAIVPGTTVTINSRPVQADDEGRFAFAFDASTAAQTTVAVLDTRGQ